MTAEVRVSRGLDPAIDHVAAMARLAWRFLSRSWFAAAGSDEMLTIVMTGAEGSPLIALPIVMIGRFMRTVPGSYWPFRSFPVAEGAGIDHMATLLSDAKARRALGPVWRLGPIYHDDPALVLLRGAAQHSRWRIYERRIATDYLLDMDAMAAEGPWPRNTTLRKNRFHEKHLADYGPLRWRFARGESWTPDLFADLAAIEAKSWHAGSTDPKFLPGTHRDFWERLARDPDQASRMNAAILYISDDPVAFSFDLDAGSVKYAIANSYDPAFGKHSPSKCLYYRNLLDARERGLTVVDWGAGDSGYKQTIGAEPAREIVDCLIVRSHLAAPLGWLIAWLWRSSGRRH